MKSTYKLLGALWDQMPCNCKIPQIIECTPSDDAIQISLSQLLSARSLDDARRLIGDNSGKKIIVDLDFSLKTDNNVTNTFFNKRICQISTFISKEFGNINFTKNSVV